MFIYSQDSTQNDAGTEKSLQASDFIPDVCENNREINSVQRGDIIISGHQEQWLRLHPQNILFALIPKKTKCLIKLFTWLMWMNSPVYMETLHAPVIEHRLPLSRSIFSKKKNICAYSKPCLRVVLFFLLTRKAVLLYFFLALQTLTRHRPQLTVNRQEAPGWVHIPNVLYTRLKKAVI